VAIEVKLATVEPPGGDWSMSRDFLQLRHYNDQLAVPGVLDDAHRVLLVEHGADQRYLDIMGRSASDGQMEAIRDHLLRSSTRGPANLVRNPIPMLRPGTPVFCGDRRASTGPATRSSCGA
jgi:hypothetical protein